MSFLTILQLFVAVLSLLLLIDRARAGGFFACIQLGAYVACAIALVGVLLARIVPHSSHTTDHVTGICVNQGKAIGCQPDFAPSSLFEPSIAHTEGASRKK